MPRATLLRRVVILCQAVARNLAYYRVGWRDEFKSILDYKAHPESANFFRVANSNFIDTLVLEWCKLFADKKGKYYWGNVVTDKAGFKAGLLKALEIDEAGFEQVIESMRHYRDKFLAHLDSEGTMNIPALDIPKKATWFYYACLVANEAVDEEFLGLDADLDLLYRRMEMEAEAAYRRVQ
jgi:hypothetical protein